MSADSLSVPPSGPSLTLSTVILPDRRWAEGGHRWRDAEQLGFRAAYTYDHLSWRSFRGGPWFGAVPTLTAAAMSTSTLRLGTLVSSPNFRHPVPFAKELLTLDDLSGGRIEVGLGAGGTGFDATALGQQRWTPRERADRFGEFVPLLDQLLTSPEVTADGAHYRAEAVENVPGCVQQPRLPFLVAATGPRGMKLAARYGQTWVTTGDPRVAEGASVADADAALAAQLDAWRACCADQGRPVDTIGRMLLVGFTPEANSPLASLDAFVDFAGRHRALGFTELVIHWPIEDSVFAADQAVFERIATEALDQLH